MRQAVLAGVVLAGALAAGAWAQNPGPAQKVALRGTAWADLTPAQRSALAPLQHEWNDLGPERRAKWLEVATRYPQMSEAERSRMQARMEAWSRMSPQERGQARLRYQQAQTVSPQEREKRWAEYQALPPEQRRQLANRSASKSDAAPRKPEPHAVIAGPRQQKSNVVPSPAIAPAPKAVAPTIVQGKPGATTTLITRPPKPPTHQQSGLPKIAATPGLVDSATLLPQRGAQGAAARPKPAPPQPVDKAQQAQ
jgi:hypothetical protein